MTEYHVTWSIEVDAESPEDAAKQAREIQLDPESEATCFEIRKGYDCDARGNHDVVATVDLFDLRAIGVSADGQ